MRELLAEGVSVQRLVVEGVKEVKQAFHATGDVPKRCQNGQFPSLIDLKIAENAVFYLKVLNKIYFQDVFEEYIIFKFFVT